MNREALRAALFLGLILNAIFFPALWGGRTLLLSSWEAPSIMPSGAYSEDQVPSHVSRTPDPGAPAWQSEPWFKIISDQYWKEHSLPLWNPYSAYGTPLAAAMQPQPFFPLAALLSIHPTAWTYDIFVIGRLLIAGLLMFLFARLFLRFIPSLFAAVTFMLSGYFILYLNMPHLSVEVLLPGVFLAFEILLRKNTWTAVIGAAIIVFISFTGGMPESLFLTVGFGGLYFLLRLVFTPEFHARPFSRVGKLAAGVSLGFVLSAFLLLPFLEFIRISHDTHQASNSGGVISGLATDDDLRTTILYLLPLLFGPVNNSIFSGLSGWTGIRAYWGITPCLFALAAVIFYCVRRDAAYPKALRFLTVFFSVSLALMVLKRFGSPIINWIGHLPIFEMVVYVKYQEPLIAFCVAMLAGIGFSLLTEKQVKPSYFVKIAILLFVIMLALVGWSLPNVLAHKELAFVYYLIAFSGALVLLTMIALLTWAPKAPWLTLSLLGFLTVELCLNFIVPSFYVFSQLPSAQRSPYAGAPYIEFLHRQDQDRYRVFARDGALYPNWSGVFMLADVRGLDALYYRPYISFVRSFLLRPGDEIRRNGDLADRFTGSGDGYAYAFVSETEKRFLALSSVKYLIGVTEFGAASNVLDEIIDQHRSQNLWGFGRDSFLVGDGKSALGLFQHPPSHRVGYKTIIDPQKPVFEGIAAIKRGAEGKTSGVNFLLEIRSGGKIEKLFSTFLNPKDVPADRSGRHFQLDLTQYADKEVELLFSTDPGPTKNNAYAWAGWAKLHFVQSGVIPAAAPSHFKNVYDKEINVTEVAGILSRASLFRSVEILPEDEVLARLKDPAFDPQKRLIVSKESLSGDDTAAAQQLMDQPPSSYLPARISQYTSQYVRIEADAATPAILMLNDANYPGWRAYLNGTPAPILKANYLFRGVILPAGHNVVEFAYEPASFRFGTFISAGALAILGLLGAVAVSQRRRQRPELA